MRNIRTDGDARGLPTHLTLNDKQTFSQPGIEQALFEVKAAQRPTDQATRQTLAEHIS